MAMEQPGQADTRPAEELGRDHRVEQGCQMKVVVAPQVHHVLFRGVKHLHDGPLPQHLAEGLQPLQGQRIDQVDLLPVGDLNEAAFVEVVIEGVGLRVDGERPRLRESSRGPEQCLIVVDPGVAGGSVQGTATP